MKLLFKTIYFFVFLVFLVYVLLPSQEFPPAPPGAVQSFEPADSETPLRRAYFTNATREEVILHYKKEFGNSLLRLNYPPEEVQTIIREQTRGSYLEELVYPFRESLFVTGFIPKYEKDAIVIDNVKYYQKITVRHVPSSTIARVFYVLLVAVVGYLLIFKVSSFLNNLSVWFFSLIKWKK